MIFSEASRGVVALSMSADATGCEFDSHSGKFYIYYIHFFFSGIEVNNTRNASGIRLKRGTAGACCVREGHQLPYCTYMS